MAFDGDKKESQDPQHIDNPMKLTEYNQILYPYFFGKEPRIQLENIKNIQSKTGDIFVCSYPKSGTHWIMEMVNMLVAGSTEHPTKFNFLDPMIISDQVLDSIPCPRVFHSHLRFNQLPDSFLKRKGKIIYILRNPKDVSVSLYNFVQKEGRMKYSGAWNDCFQLFVSGKVGYSSWFDHVLSWEREKEKGRHPIHFVFYEDLKEDAVRELDRISKFLSLKHQKSFLQSVAESSTFIKMRNQKYLYHPFPAEVMDENYADFLFRRGIVGDWRSWFSEEQSKQLDAVYKAEMSDSRLVFNYG
ncbi:hypothetical protein ACJMK2_008303 [Sinanodonta woodiana]|uniref:Sulfotransferase domain-containing protein n=1 Tax=Sinanodonta woodiana TaxID=1069815 RepID=A0ABD3VL62_SINWO